MSNFAKRMVARESIENDVNVTGLVEAPEDNVEAHIEEAQDDTTEIDSLEQDGGTLAEDAEAAEGAVDLVEESDEELDETTATAIDVAQESIRRRWGIRSHSIARESASGYRARRTVAREGVWETLKELFQKVIDWFKRMGHKVKERWLKFSNAGKSIQKRSKKFDKQIQALGSKDKDEISGAFIKQLSVGNSFKGNVPAELNAALKTAKDANKEVGEAYELLAKTVSVDLNEQDFVSNGSQATNKLGNLFVASNTDEPLLNGKLSRYVAATDEELGKMDFVDAENDEAATDVPTPSISELNAANDIYHSVGKYMEKQITEYQKVERARAALEKKMDDIKKDIDKAESGIAKDDSQADSKKEGIKLSRKMIMGVEGMVSTTNSIASHNLKSISTGMGGYIAAGIGAYKKK